MRIWAKLTKYILKLVIVYSLSYGIFLEFTKFDFINSVSILPLWVMPATIFASIFGGFAGLAVKKLLGMFYGLLIGALGGTVGVILGIVFSRYYFLMIGQLVSTLGIEAITQGVSVTVVSGLGGMTFAFAWVLLAVVMVLPLETGFNLDKFEFSVYLRGAVVVIIFSLGIGFVLGFYWSDIFCQTFLDNLCSNNFAPLRR